MEELAARVFVASCEKGDLAAVSSDDLKLSPFQDCPIFRIIVFVLCLLYFVSSFIYLM